MRFSVRKAVAFLSLAAGGGYILAGPGTGCGSYIAETTLSATDFCFIFDCQNGVFGGTIDPCASSDTQDPVLVDCP